jgi:hypothetical protein
MKRHSSSNLAVCLIGALVLSPMTLMAQAATSYSGQATALKATAVGISIMAADTGQLPSTGGSITRDLANVNVAGLVMASALHAATSGSGSSSQSSTHLVNVVVLSSLVHATGVSTSTTATCNGSTASTSGDTQFAMLQVAGQQIVNANPNLAISLPGGISVVVNEQTSSGDGGTSAQTTVNALHITAPGVDIVVGSSHSDITCSSSGSNH